MKSNQPLIASVGLRLTPELRKKVLDVSKRIGLKPAEIIRLCVDAQLDEIEKTGQFRLNLKQK